MRQVLLQRYAYTPLGTFGQLSIVGTNFKCHTVEEVWRGNRRGVSCIPLGAYPLRLARFYRNTPDPSDDYDVYEVLQVPGRSAIKVHIANTIDDVEGCIGPGEEFGALLSKGRHLPAVLNSRKAFLAFMEAMEGAPEALLTVTGPVAVEWP